MYALDRTVFRGSYESKSSHDDKSNMLFVVTQPTKFAKFKSFWVLSIFQYDSFRENYALV